jgi:hypothetical protein
MATRPSLVVRLTEDFKVNLNRRYWFIEVEQYFWSRYASKHFKNVSFKEWLDYQIVDLRKYINIRMVAEKKPLPEQRKFAVSGLYDSYADKKKKKAITLAIWRWNWPEYAEPGSKERLMHLLIKTLVHELNHVRQSRTRNYWANYVPWEYWQDPDEIECYALNAAQSLVARYGIKGARDRAIKFKTKDSHCSELNEYAVRTDEYVQQKFIKKVLRYIETYESYEKEGGKLFCHRIKKHGAITKSKIKSVTAS